MAPNIKAPIAACSTTSRSPRPSLCPLRLSLRDRRIIEAHEQAVTTALCQLESFAATRVRRTGQCTARATGNIVAAVFRHETSRALDPHLHSHCILFNATHDPVENRWKPWRITRFRGYQVIEGLYYHEWPCVAQFGYAIDNKQRGDFDVKGVAPSLIEKFSKRHQEMDQKTRELLEREPQKAHGNIAAIRENIATRRRPQDSEHQAPWTPSHLGRSIDPSGEDIAGGVGCPVVRRRSDVFSAGVN